MEYPVTARHLAGSGQLIHRGDARFARRLPRLRPLLAGGALLLFASLSIAADDTREMVQMPDMMQGHMLSNMRDHLAAINEILTRMTEGEVDKAAQIAETRLGMSSLEAHGASHMAPFMPENMRDIGTRMHHAASRFALRAQEGDPAPAYRALSEVTATCVACHSAYRIR